MAVGVLNIDIPVEQLVELAHELLYRLGQGFEFRIRSDKVGVARTSDHVRLRVVASGMRHPKGGHLHSTGFEA